MIKVAVIDDWQAVAADCADWFKLSDASVQFIHRPFVDEEDAAEMLADADVIVPMRERTRFPISLLERLPRLRLIALTGYGISHVDTQYCAEKNIALTGSGSYSPAATAELTIGLMIAAARDLVGGDRRVRSGFFQAGQPLGQTLEGTTLGIVGLGRIGTRVATIANAIGMEVVAWSPNLTSERAATAKVRLADSLQDLCRQCGVISIHIPLSAQTLNLIGLAELACMRKGAILVNTSRAGLVDTAALLDCLEHETIVAAFDVYKTEPLPLDDPIVRARGTILSPHLGYNTRTAFEAFYGQCVENIRAWQDGAPTRLIAL